MRIYRHQEAVFPASPREYKETEVSDSAFRIVGIQKPEEAVLQVKRNGIRDVRFCLGQFFF